MSINVVVLILVFIILILLFVSRNLYVKLNYYENEYYLTRDWIVSFKSRVQSTLDEMKKIDSSGVFEADDEVGNTFKDLFSIILDLELYLKSTFGENSSGPKKESE